MNKRIAIILFALLTLGVCVPAAFAQSSGTVQGTCKDAQGNPIPDAIVVYTNLDNGQKYALKTNKKGQYFSLGLSAGKYNIVVYRNADDQKANKEMDHANGFAVQIGLQESSPPFVSILTPKHASASDFCKREGFG